MIVAIRGGNASVKEMAEAGGYPKERDFEAFTPDPGFRVEGQSWAMN